MSDTFQLLEEINKADSDNIHFMRKVAYYFFYENNMEELEPEGHSGTHYFIDRVATAIQKITAEMEL